MYPSTIWPTAESALTARLSPKLAAAAELRGGSLLDLKRENVDNIAGHDRLRHLEFA
jgi:hypothetical protein